MDRRSTHWRWRAPSRSTRPGRVELERRGVRHGSVESIAAPPSAPEDLARRYQSAHPILLRGWLAVGGKRARASIEGSRLWFDRLRGGEGLDVGLRARLARRGAAAAGARVVGVSEDVGDPL